MKILIGVNDSNESPTIDKIGKKAFNLFWLHQNKLQVPTFSVLPSSVIHQILAPLKQEINELFNLIEQQEGEALARTLDAFQNKILKLKVEEEITDSLLKECTTLFGHNYRISVRSSAPIEDGENASFAGQFNSYLNVGDNEVINRVLRCISSFWNFGVITYRKSKRILSREYQFAVVLQQMVNAASSGVAFSVNENQNMADALIVAGYGVGEGIVTDQTDTDSYKVDRQSRSIAPRITTKTTFFSNDENGISEKPVPEALREVPALTDEEVLTVFDATLKAEEILGFPADVEFAFDQDGRFHLLQMRPITTINKEEVIILDNTNIIESYPGLTLPLSYTFALKNYQIVFKNSAKAFWVSKAKVRELELVFSDLLHLFQGRVYYRLDNWYRMIGIVHKSKRSIKAWETAVGLKDSQESKKKSNILGLAKMTLASLWMLLNHPFRVPRFFKQFKLNYDKLREFSGINDSPKKLWLHYNKYTQNLFKHWYITIINDFLAFKFFGLLQGALKRFGISADVSIANDIITNHLKVESELAIINVLKLKQNVSEDTALLEVFKKESNQILVDIQAKEYAHFLGEFNRHLDLYGDRTLAELKLETPSLRQQPETLILLIQNQLKSKVTLQSYLNNKDEIKNLAWKKIKEKSGFLGVKYLTIKILTFIAASGLKNRENMRFSRTRAFGAIKEIFIEIGKQLAKDNVINVPEDVFYLELSSLENYCTTGKLADQKQHIESLKKQYKSHKSLTLPDRVIYHKESEPHFENIENFNLSSNEYKGLAVSKGTITAEVIVVDEPDFKIDVTGKILITRMTDPGWVFLMSQARGIISEKGSLLSHTAIIGRELGIPVVVGLSHATQIFKNGQTVTLDGNTGLITI